jgi:hypothetical protein
MFGGAAMWNNPLKKFIKSIWNVLNF